MKKQVTTCDGCERDFNNEYCTEIDIDGVMKDACKECKARIDSYIPRSPSDTTTINGVTVSLGMFKDLWKSGYGSYSDCKFFE